MRIDIPDSRRMLKRGFAASPPFKLLHANFSRRCADSCILRPTRTRAGQRKMFLELSETVRKSSSETSDVSRSAEACRTKPDGPRFIDNLYRRVVKTVEMARTVEIHIRRDRSRSPAKIWTRGFRPRVSGWRVKQE